MKAFIAVVVLFLATVAFGASEEVGSSEAKPSEDSGYRFYGPDNMFKPRPARLVSGMKPQGWLGGNPAIAENDPNYYPKLFDLLDKIGRR